jgi:peptidoglycan/LPS O-acetylase OafA/YrhL
MDMQKGPQGGQVGGELSDFRGHVPALDGIRGMAIAMVMLSHFILRPLWADQQTYYLVQSGWIGVDMFFVLSGFLITGILLDTREREGYYQRFYKRRVLRIFPLYYFAVIVTWLTVLLVEHGAARLHGYNSFGWFFAFAPNIAAALKNDWPYYSHVFDLNHLWSLAVEEQFYLLWPLVVRWVPIRWLALLCVALMAASLPLRHWVAGAEQAGTVASYVLPFTRMDGLAAGAFLAVAYRLDLQHFVPFHRWAFRLLLLWSGWEIYQIFCTGTALRLYALNAVFFASLLHLSLNPHPRAAVRWLCERAWLRHLGKYSFGLYIFHQMFRFGWERWFGHALLESHWPPMLAQATYILLAFCGTYILARLSWRFLEEPILRMKEK